MRGSLWVFLVAAGCYQPTIAPGQPCAENGACPEGFECRTGTCELPDGTSDGPLPDVPIDACAGATCSGNDIVGCGPPVTCTTACSSIGGAHCMVLVPSNGLSRGMLAGATANVTGNDWDFDTVSGGIKKGNIILRADGTGVNAGIGFQIVDGMGVFTAHSFNVSAVDDFSASGTNTLVLFAATTITVSGTIDVGSYSSAAGSGGSSGTSSTSGASCRGRAGRFFSNAFAEGGGGGGGRTAGGDGGAANQGAPAGLGGALCTLLSTTTPLRGGAGGGHGGGQTANSGGGGGGGLALVAMESISITGSVGSPGGPGISGPGPSPSGDGGGGGGAGGAVFLEAPTVTISGALTANGGSGASPFNVNGARGSLSTGSSVAGGSYMGVSGGRGGSGALSPGSGAIYTTTDTVPVPPVITSARGSGGGGAAGRTEIKALVRNTTGATLSPLPTTTPAMLE